MLEWPACQIINLLKIKFLRSLNPPPLHHHYNYHHHHHHHIQFIFLTTCFRIVNLHEPVLFVSCFDFKCLHYSFFFLNLPKVFFPWFYKKPHLIRLQVISHQYANCPRLTSTHQNTLYKTPKNAFSPSLVVIYLHFTSI